MSSLSVDEARKVVLRTVARDWLEHLDPDDYRVPAYGWRIGEDLFFPDGPTVELDEDEYPVGIGLAVVNAATGRASRTSSADVFRVLTEGEEFGEHPDD